MTSKTQFWGAAKHVFCSEPYSSAFCFVPSRLLTRRQVLRATNNSAVLSSGLSDHRSLQSGDWLIKAWPSILFRSSKLTRRRIFGWRERFERWWLRATISCKSIWVPSLLSWTSAHARLDPFWILCSPEMPKLRYSPSSKDPTPTHARYLRGSIDGSVQTRRAEKARRIPKRQPECLCENAAQ